MNSGHASLCPRCGAHISKTMNKEDDPQRRSAAQMLARHLTFSLQIRQGNQLRRLPGVNGQETDTIDVIASWVLMRLGQTEQWPLPSSDAVLLVESLEAELRAYLQNIHIG